MGADHNTAVSIARSGGDVILTYLNGADAAQAVVAEIEALGRKAIALPLDVSNISTFPTFVESVRSALQSIWGRTDFDHLVNNAGHGEMDGCLMARWCRHGRLCLNDWN